MNAARIGIVYCTRFGHTEVQALAVRHGAEQVAGTKPELFSTDAALKNMESLDK